MRQLNEIEIPQDGLEITKDQCYSILQEQPREPKFTTILRLYHLQLTNYIQMAVLGILVMLIFAYFLPKSRIITVSLFFFLLGIYAIYEIYKQSIYDVDELLSTVYLNAGRSFLYKCLLCSLIQFLCFLFIVLIQVGIFQEELALIILHSILPIYLIQCLAMLFETLIINRRNVMIFYISAYAIYLSISNSLRFQLAFYSLNAILPVTIIVILLFIILLFMKSSKIKREDYRL